MTDAQAVDGTAKAGTTVLVGRLFRVRKGRAKRFEKEPAKESPKEPEKRPARIALQLALAYEIQTAIEAGEIKDQAEAARLLRLTRARVSQLMDLALLAPAIQEGLLDSQSPLSERALRSLSQICDWRTQIHTLQAQPASESTLGLTLTSRAGAFNRSNSCPCSE